MRTVWTEIGALILTEDNNVIWTERASIYMGDSGSTPVSDNSERSIELTGVNTESDNRNIVISGQNSDSDTRAIELSGTSSINDSRSIELHGLNLSNDSRGVELDGLALSLPVVVTHSVTDITNSSAIVHGEVTSQGE